MAEPINITEEMLQQIVTSAVQAATAAMNIPQNNQSQVHSAEKPRRPLISMSTTQEKWTYFLTRWNRYKSMTGIRDSEVVGQLLECCEEELQLGLHRSVGPDISNKTEMEVLKEIKQFAVREENTIINRNVLRGMMQNHDEDVKHFAARVRGQAEMCNYTVQCTRQGCNSLISYAEAEVRDQICKGLADPEIQQELLGHSNEITTLEDTISFIAAKEAGKRSHSALFNNQASSLSRISPYQKSKRQYPQINSEIALNKSSTSSNFDQLEKDIACDWCGKVGHGARAPSHIRKAQCPAYGKKCNQCGKLGHFIYVCRQKSKSHIADISPEITKTENVQSVFLGSVQSLSSLQHTNETDNNTQCVLPHLECSFDNKWYKTKPKDDPYINIKISICRDAYKFNGIEPPKQTSKVTNTIAVADTGARTTVAGISLLTSLGLNVTDLFSVQQKLCGANESQLDILGGLFLSISLTNQAHQHNLMCYIQKDNPRKIYLSRSACEGLGIIQPDFPEILHIGYPFMNTIASQNVIQDKLHNCKELNCNCPSRSSPPEVPNKLPFPATEENRGKLEQWLLNHYKASTFNTCENQPLPMMQGPPLQFIIDKNAKPHAVHTPIPVPVHWQKAVKAGLDRDVKLGVIEPVPWGTPTTWCSRMVVVAKKDGTPRRTVNLQPLNAVSARQTHHTPSPFNQVSSIPHNMKKTVCDAWNGYHSVPIPM